MRIITGALALALLMLPGTALAAPPADIDAFVAQMMKRFGAPGMSVAIVEDGKATLTKGYGIRTLGRPELADEHTIFPIGSETKAFTAAALAILVERGKLKWEDRVVDHMPSFQMHDPYVTAHFTVRDLLTHRSGLGLGQGDLLFVPTTDRSRKEMVHALRFLKPKTGFREFFAYDNVLYVVAGQLVEEVSGLSWEDFVRQNLLNPVGMRDANYDIRTGSNRISLHARTDGPIRGMGEMRVLTSGLDMVATAPAGAINASAVDMARWMQVLLGGGKTPEGKAVFSKEQLDEMWAPVVIVPVSPVLEAIPEITPNIDTYALGWGVRDYRGHKIITHSGGVLGAVALLVIIPEKKVGISVTINSEDSMARLSVVYRLVDHYLGTPAVDWAGKFEKLRNDMFAGGLEALKAQPEQLKPNGNFTLPMAGYAGTYRDPWYGTVTVLESAGALRIRFDRTPGMEGALEPVADDTFRTHWTDRSTEDAYVKFEVGKHGKVTRASMRAISPLADFSFDYQDLDLVPEVAKAKR